MALSPDDRKAFSLKIVSADGEIATYQKAKDQLSGELSKAQKIDDANKNLFDPVNSKVNSYQQEIGKLDGNQRESIVEQDIQDSSAVKIRNHFYPNDTSTTVPTLSGSNSVWTKAKPFGLTYAIGKNYTESYTVITKESDIIDAAIAMIDSAGSNLDVENTSGQHVSSTSGVCSIPSFTDQASCVAGSGIWTPGISTITSFASVITLKSNLVTKINDLVTFLNGEASVIVSDESDLTIKGQNDAALSNINSTIKPALSTWLAYPDFNSVPGSVTAVTFNSFNSNTLAPTKLHSTQLATLKTALQTRKTFVTTRISQLQAVLGSISQDLSTGNISSSSGLYGKRYGFLLLRLDLLGGSLSKLASMKLASGAQDSIISSIVSSKATYSSVVPTSAFLAPANGTAIVQLADVSFLAPGDTVYIVSETQPELQRAVKSISGKAVTLNDIVPTKYKTSDKLRLYKDQA